MSKLIKKKLIPACPLAAKLKLKKIVGIRTNKKKISTSDAVPFIGIHL